MRKRPKSKSGKVCWCARTLPAHRDNARGAFRNRARIFAAFSRKRAAFFAPPALPPSFCPRAGSEPWLERSFVTEEKKQTSRRKPPQQAERRDNEPHRSRRTSAQTRCRWRG